MIKNTLNMKTITEGLKGIFTHRESAHTYLSSKTTEEKVALIARAHSIYFRRCDSANYDDIMKRWFHVTGLRVRTGEVWISPFSVQSRYEVTDGSQLRFSIIFTTERVQG